MSNHKIDPKLLHSTVDGLCGDPNPDREGPGTWNGEPGFPKRTASKDGVPEKSYDAEGKE